MGLSFTLPQPTLSSHWTSLSLSQISFSSSPYLPVNSDGPPAPALTVTASTGSWKPATPTGSLPPAALDGMGRGLHINSANDFCLLMPPNPVEQNLVDAEAVAVAYCMNPTNTTRPMPDSFIKSAWVRMSRKPLVLLNHFSSRKLLGDERLLLISLLSPSMVHASPLPIYSFAAISARLTTTYWSLERMTLLSWT